jgi:hypothetical protein
MKTDLRPSAVRFLRILPDFIGPVVAAVFGTAVWLILIAQSDTPNESITLWLRTLLTLSGFAFLYLTAWTIAGRSGALSKSQTIFALVAIGPLLGYAFLCIHVKHADLPWEYGTLFTSLGILAVIVLPWIRRSDDTGFWMYNWQLLGRLIWTGAIGFVLVLGLEGALFAIAYLFQQTINERVYLGLLAVVCGLIMPLHFLVGIPAAGTTSTFPKFIRVFAIYILVPILTIYLVILYIYVAQILLTQQWPRDGVARIVLWYAFIGLSALAFATPLLTGSNKGRIIARVYWITLLPLLLLLFFAVGKRIAEYGITESRYELTLVGVWFLLNACYSLVRNPAALRVYALGLFGLLLVALIPGINPVALSIQSQFARIPTGQHMLRLNPTDSELQLAAENLFYYLFRRVDYQAFQPYVTVDLGSLAKDIEADEQEHRDPATLESAVFPQLKQVEAQVTQFRFSVDETPSNGNSSEPLSISDFQRLTRFSAIADWNSSQYRVTLDGQSIVFHRDDGDLKFSLQALMTSLTQNEKTTDTSNLGWNALRVVDPSGKTVLQLTDISLEKREGGCSATRVDGFLLER